MIRVPHPAEILTPRFILSVLLVLGLILLLPGPAAAANVTPAQSVLPAGYISTFAEIPPWMWVLFLVGGILLLLYSLRPELPLQSAWITSVLSLLFLFTALGTSLSIREMSFTSVMNVTAEAGGNLTALTVIQPVATAWSPVVPLLFALGLVIPGILNFVVLTLEMGGPGLRYFRGNIFRRG